MRKKVLISVDPQALESIDEMASERNMSRSEFLVTTALAVHRRAAPVGDHDPGLRDAYERALDLVSSLRRLIEGR